MQSLVIHNPQRVGGQWKEIGALNTACSNPCVVPFRDKYLVKFGGVCGISSTVIHTVEIFDVDTNKWYPLNTVPSKHNTNSQSYYNVLNYMCDTISSIGYQRDDNHITVFGGLNSSQSHS